MNKVFTDHVQAENHDGKIALLEWYLIPLLRSQKLKSNTIPNSPNSAGTHCRAQGTVTSYRRKYAKVRRLRVRLGVLFLT